MTVDPDPAAQTPGRARLSWRSAAFVVLGNLIPILGVVFLGWNAVQILLLYWCETVIIGVFTLPRILSAQAVLPTTPSEPGSGGYQIPLDTLKGRSLLAIFFVVHYGIFCLAHAFFATGMLTGFDPGWRDLWRETLTNRDVLIAVAGIAAIQIVLQVKDWWLSGLWRRSDPGTEMMRPYGRVLVMHMTVILGFWMVGGMGAPVGAVFTLCLVKAVAEILVLTRRPKPKVLPV
ncbi:DUF6498-containing protein [Brevundimonas sp.]|uniref:DUF6498-containing protein n=1 Tax=Brevundimonas sp. TaxID=1871086 RepID=UPI001A2798CA|nr:DUF6498-containing protein [Brevundimonas sp.]MBJ7485431.1 hypothetical protein [Brevundimonas sp.]